MRGLVLLVPAMALTLAGCGGGSAGPAPRPASPGTAKAAPSTPKPSPAHREKATSNVHACYDGTCLLKVRGPKTVPLDAKRFHYSRLEIVDVTSSELSYQVPYGGGGGASSSMGVGGGGGFGFRDKPSIELHLQSIRGGTALLSLRAKPHA